MLLLVIPFPYFATKEKKRKKLANSKVTTAKNYFSHPISWFHYEKKINTQFKLTKEINVIIYK